MLSRAKTGLPAATPAAMFSGFGAAGGAGLPKASFYYAYSHRERYPESFDTAHIKDAGHTRYASS